MRGDGVAVRTGSLKLELNDAFSPKITSLFRLACRLVLTLAGVLPSQPSNTSGLSQPLLLRSLTR